MLSIWFMPSTVAHWKNRHGLHLGHGLPVENHGLKGDYVHWKESFSSKESDTKILQSVYVAY